MIRALVLLVLSAAAGFAQCGKMAMNPATGKLDCIGNSSAIAACVGAPGNTIGPYHSLCTTTGGSLYACKNAAGCTVAADWQSQAGSATASGSDGQLQYNTGGALDANTGLTYNSGTFGLTVKGPLSLGLAGVGTGSVTLAGTTSGSVNLTSDATATKLVVNKPITSNAGITLGANSGTGGSIALNGATSGTATLTTAADGSSVTLDKAISAASFNGQLHETVTSINNAASPYTVLTADAYIYCDATAGAVVINLPASTGSGREISVKKIDSSANGCTVTRAGSDVIDGATTVPLTSRWAASKVLDRAAGFWDRTHVSQLVGDVTGANTANIVSTIGGAAIAPIATSGSANDLSAGTIPTGRLPSNVPWPGNACPSGYYCVDSSHYATLAAAWTACTTATLKTCPIFIQLPYTATSIPWAYDNTETMVPKILTSPGVLTTQVQIGIPHLGGFTGAGRAGLPSSTVGTGGTTIRPGSSFSTTWAVSNVAVSSGTVYTYTTATNTLSTGDWASVAGISPADYNFQRCQVTVLTSTTFTCDLGYNPAAYVSGGTAAPNKFLVYLGDTVSQNASGTRISEVTVDCAVNGNTPVQGCSGIEVAQAQEQSGLVHVNTVDYTGWGIWIHGTGTQNSSYLDFEANGCYASLSGPCFIGSAPGNTAVNPAGIGTVPLEVDNTSYVKSVGPATLNTVNTNSATESTLTCTSGTATFTASAAFDTWLGKNNWVNVSGASVAGFNGAYKVTPTSTTAFTYSFTGGACPAGSASGATATVAPALDYVVCSGTACSDGGPTSTTIVTNNNVHMERAGIGLLITGAAAVVNTNGNTCSTSPNTSVATCEQWAANLVRAPVTTSLWQMGNSVFVNAIGLNDLIHNVTYVGTVASTIGGELTGLMRGGSPLTAAELSGDVITNGSNVVTVQKLNNTSLAGLATGLVKITTITGVPSIATLSDITNLTGTGQTAATNLGLVSAYLQFFCTGVVTSSATLIMPGPVSACTTTTTGPKYALPAGRILKNLRVRSSGNGVSASSGLFTVLVNAAVSTGITCTVGTAAVCSDLTHTYTINANDVVYLNYTTQASETTLANISVTLEVQ